MLRYLSNGFINVREKKRGRRRAGEGLSGQRELADEQLVQHDGGRAVEERVFAESGRDDLDGRPPAALHAGVEHVIKDADEALRHVFRHAADDVRTSTRRAKLLPHKGHHVCVPARAHRRGFRVIQADGRCHRERPQVR